MFCLRNGMWYGEGLESALNIHEHSLVRSRSEINERESGSNAIIVGSLERSIRNIPMEKVELAPNPPPGFIPIPKVPPGFNAAECKAVEESH